MRDEQDPGTLELMLPRKRGRPPTFGYAMTDAQRAARYRARRAGQADHADLPLPGCRCLRSSRGGYRAIW